MSNSFDLKKYEFVKCWQHFKWLNAFTPTFADIDLIRYGKYKWKGLSLFDFYLATSILVVKQIHAHISKIFSVLMWKIKYWTPLNLDFFKYSRQIYLMVLLMYLIENN